MSSEKEKPSRFLSAVIYDYAVIGILYMCSYPDENGGKRPAKNCFNNCNILVSLKAKAKDT